MVEERVEAVRRMQGYMQENLKGSVTLYALARVAGYSPWHSARMFRELTGETPIGYLRKLRLTQAALQLRDNGGKIVDVALDFVFDSHEGFTRAFSRQFGLTPEQYRSRKPPIPLFHPYQVPRRIGACTVQKRTQTVFVQVIDRPARKVLLRRAREAADYFAYCEEVGCEVWGVLTSVKEALYEPIGMWLPQALRPDGTSLYVQGVELAVDYAGEVPEGFELLDLPPVKMMVFQGEPYEEDAEGEAIGQVWEAIDRYDPRLYGFEWAPEDGPRFQLEPMPYRGYIEARPVRPTMAR